MDLPNLPQEMNDKIWRLVHESFVKELKEELVEESCEYWMNWNYNLRYIRPNGLWDEYLDDDEDLLEEDKENENNNIYPNQFDSRYPCFSDEILGEMILV